MIYSSHEYIGIWEYYSENGDLDSIIDYDKKQTISYYQAVQIASENGFYIPEIDICKSFEKGRAFWQVNRWIENEDGSGRTAETILIDSSTGDVSKPEYILMGIY